MLWQETNSNVRACVAATCALLVVLVIGHLLGAEAAAAGGRGVPAGPGKLSDPRAPEVLDAVRSIRAARLRMGAGKRIFADVGDEVRKIRMASMNLVKALARGDAQAEFARLEGHADQLETTLQRLGLEQRDARERREKRKQRGKRPGDSRLHAVDLRCKRLLGQLRRIGKGRTRAVQAQRALQLVHDLDTAGGRISRALSAASQPTFTVRKAAPELHARRAQRVRKDGRNRGSREGR